MYKYRVSFKDKEGDSTIVFSDNIGYGTYNLKTTDDFTFEREELYTEEELFEKVLKGTPNLGKLERCIEIPKDSEGKTIII